MAGPGRHRVRRIAARDPQPRRARYVGRWALGIVFLAFGAATNAVYLATSPEHYDEFAAASGAGMLRQRGLILRR